MAELAYTDLPAAVLARFADKTVATAAINAALSAARRYCGWYVSPVQTDQVIADIDGPGGRELSLPTLNLISVSAVTELGVTVDVSTLDKSRRKGTLTKQWPQCWTNRDGAITATITHGYTEAEAADWRAAILAIVDARSSPAGRDDGDLKRKKVDDVEYEWLTGMVTDDQELSLKLSQFRILPSP